MSIPPTCTDEKTRFNFLLCNGLSQLGDWMRVIALNWLIVTELQQTAVEANLLRVVAAAGSVAGLLLPMWLFERLGSRRSLIISSIGFALISFATALLVAFNALTVELIWASGFLYSLIRVLYLPAESMLLRSLGGGRQWQLGVDFDRLTWLSRSAIGLAAGLLLRFGSGLLLFLDALSFLPLATFLYGRDIGNEVVHAERERLEIGRVWRYLQAHPALRLLLCFTAIREATQGVAFVMTAHIIAKELARSGFDYGLWLGITGLGGLGGNVLSRRLFHRSRPERLRSYLWCMAACTVSLLGAACSATISSYIVCYSLFVFFISPAETLHKTEFRLVDVEMVRPLAKCLAVLDQGIFPLIWLAVTASVRTMHWEMRQGLAASVLLGAFGMMAVMAGSYFRKKEYRDWFATPWMA